jgi:carboxymethylenebutenolidase
VITRTVVCVAAFLGVTQVAIAQDWARQRLEKSPRHHEWVVVKHGDRTLHAFLVYPEVKSKAPAVIVTAGSPTGCAASPTSSPRQA